MTHKEIVRKAIDFLYPNVVHFLVYRDYRREDVAIVPPANSRQVFAPKPKRKFKTDKQRVAERNRPSSY